MGTNKPFQKLSFLTIWSMIDAKAAALCAINFGTVNFFRVAAELAPAVQTVCIKLDSMIITEPSSSMTALI